MVQSAEDDAGQGRAGALEALLDVAREPDIISDYRIVTAAFEPDDYQQIIALAWRYQFTEDRSKFKREIRELQEHISQRIAAKLEQPE
jgi:hypothetical protein